MRCNKCGSDWNTALSVNVNNCPFCGNGFERHVAPLIFDSAAIGFAHTIRTYGSGLLYDSTRLYAFLSDIIPNFPTERRVIKTAAEMGIYGIFEEAAAKGDTDKELAIKKAVRVLTQGAGLTERWAECAAECFAVLFDWAQAVNNEHGGNSPGNIINYGSMAQWDGLFFYRNDNNGKGLYKIHPDGQGKEKLSDDNCYFINVIDGFIYYSNWSDGEKLYKIQTDGHGRTKLNDDESSFISVVDGQAYYVNGSDKDKIYKIDITGNAKKKLCDDEAQLINVTDGWIYYIAGEGNIYKVCKDGTGKTKINRNNCRNMNVSAGWIYYIDSKDGSPRKMRLDGQSDERLADEICIFMNVTEDGIYYCNGNDGRKLYKMDLNGGNAVCLANDICGRINTAGDWVFYENYSQGKKQYRVRADGTRRQEV